MSDRGPASPGLPGEGLRPRDEATGPPPPASERPSVRAVISRGHPDVREHLAVIADELDERQRTGGGLKWEGRGPGVMGATYSVAEELRLVAEYSLEHPEDLTEEARLLRNRTSRDQLINGRAPGRHIVDRMRDRRRRHPPLAEERRAHVFGTVGQAFDLADVFGDGYSAEPRADGRPPMLKDYDTDARRIERRAFEALIEDGENEARDAKYREGGVP